MNNDIIRKMPFSMIAEQALLGSVLLDPESIRNVADTLSDSDFYVAEHQQIFGYYFLYVVRNEYLIVIELHLSLDALEFALYLREI